MAVDFVPDDHINLGQWDVSGDTMSISLWFKMTTTPGDSRLIMKGVGTAGGDHYWGFAMNGGNDKPTFRIFASAALTSLEASSALSAGVWYHIVGTYDGITMRIYIDAVEENTVAKTGNVRTGAVDIWLGDQPGDPGSRPTDGCLADVRVYDRVLSPEEIQAIFHARGIDGIVLGILGRWMLNGGAPGDTVPAAAGAVKDLVGDRPGTQTGDPAFAGDTLRLRRRR
jgi:hypothetical protein